MIITFAFASSADSTGGVIALYEYANALARRGHDVHFAHGPAWPTRIDRLDQLPEFAFEPGVVHHIVDTLDDPSLPEGDIVFTHKAPSRLGQQAVFVQGYRMVPFEIERAAFRLPMPKICVASWLADVGLTFGVPAEQLWTVPLGMDHELFSLRTPYDARPVDVAMLFHPHKQKGWDVGVQVLAELRRRQPDRRLVVFSRVVPEDLPAGVEFVFAPDQTTLAAEIYNGSRVFVQTSHHEGFGWTAIEAMACGSALVTTDNGGSRDYAMPGETALVAPVGDGAGLVASVERLLLDNDLRVRIATAGERYVRKFDWDLSGELLEAQLEKYLADPPSFQRLPTDDETAREE